VVVSRAALIMALVAACSSKSEEPAPAQPAVPAVPADAAVDGITQIGEPDPTRHLDDDGAPTRTPTRTRQRPSTPIGVMMKSTPGGADAYVDGQHVGVTPHYWQGDADGQEHTFTFILRGHAVAHYRFVPITSGVVHVTLERVAVDVTDGGLPPRIAPSFVPDAAVAPPPTILSPADAAVAPVVAPVVAPDAAEAPAVTPSGAGPQP